MDPVTNLLVGKVFSLGWDKLVTPILQDASTSLNSIYVLLADEAERNRLAPLKKAYLYLEDEQFDEAAKNLINAISVDDFAAVPRLLYGLILINKKGKTDIGARHIRDALSLNPFVIEQLFPFDNFDVEREIANTVFSEEWELPLADLPLTTVGEQETIRLKWRQMKAYWRSLFQLVPAFSQAAIQCATASSEGVILSCVISENLRKERLSCLLKVGRGKFDWVVEATDEQPIMAGSRLVMTVSEQGTANIRDINSGKILSTGSRSYFTGMLLPDSVLRENSMHQLSNAKMELSDDVLRLLSRQFDDEGFAIAEPGFDHEAVRTRRVEEKIIRSHNGQKFVVKNNFEHWHTGSMGANLAGTCMLSGWSRIRALPTKAVDAKSASPVASLPG